MDTLIKIGIIVVAVVAIVGVLSAFLPIFQDGFLDFASNFNPLVNAVAPYLLFGRSLVNYLLGSETVCNIVLWFVLLAPFTEHIALLLNKIYKKLTS